MFHILRVKLLTLQSVWTRYTLAPRPFQVTDDEIKVWRIEAQQWQDREDELDELSRSIRVDKEGWVPAEDFEETYDRYRKVKKEWISKGGTERDWPFSGPMVDEHQETPRNKVVFWSQCSVSSGTLLPVL